MNTPLPKPTAPDANKAQPPQGSIAVDKNSAVDPTKIGRSVAPTGVPKMEGLNPNLAPKLAVTPTVTPTPAIKPEIKAPLAPPAKHGLQPVPPTGGPAANAGSAGSAPAKNQPALAKPKDSKKMIIMIAAALIAVGVIGTLLSNIFGGNKTTSTTGTNNTTNTNKKPADTTPPAEQTVLTYWGLWEPNGVLDEVIQAYQTQNPGIKVDYRVQSHKDYRERLQTAIASGNGPDIFRYHASWVPMLGTDLAVLPANVMSAAEFKETFYPSAAQMLQIDGKIVGLPIMYEGLGLYYNKDI